MCCQNGSMDLHKETTGCRVGAHLALPQLPYIRNSRVLTTRAEQCYARSASQMPPPTCIEKAEIRNQIPKLPLAFKCLPLNRARSDRPPRSKTCVMAGI
jgi:hypothetical protein